MTPKTVVAALLFTIGAVIGAPPAAAYPAYPNCQTDAIGIFKAKQRTVCDTPVRPDGSWSRTRVFWVPAHQVPFTCSYGTYSSSCSGGYFVDDSILENERYIVFPDNLLPDEPGHLPV